METSAQLIVLVSLLLCSATVSGSETALFALSHHDLCAMGRSENRFKRLAAQLMEQPRTVLVTVLITNTTVNVCFFAVSFFFFQALGAAYPSATWVGGLLTTFTLVLFGEVLPKAVALAHGRSLAPLIAPVIRASALVLLPLRGVLQHAVVSPLTRLILPGRGAGPQVSTDELRAVVEMSARQGVINVRENEILQQIVALPETSVRSVMVPRVDIVAVSVDADRETVCQRIRDSGKKKLPVFGRDLDDILGLIHALDLRLTPDRPLGALLKSAHFVPEQANLLQMVQDFRRTGTQLAVVVDEHGGTSGLVTLEDVMEHIVGDIADADEAPSAPTIEVIDERAYRLSGGISVRALADYFGVRPGAEGVETLGGFMLSQLGRLPQPGDVVLAANLRLTVERVAARRVEQVLVELVASTDAPADQERAK